LHNSFELSNFVVVTKRFHKIRRIMQRKNYKNIEQIGKSIFQPEEITEQQSISDIEVRLPIFVEFYPLHLVEYYEGLHYGMISGTC